MSVQRAHVKVICFKINFRHGAAAAADASAINLYVHEIATNFRMPFAE